MKITIKIPDQPDGYSIPTWSPIYLPLNDKLILVGTMWCLAETQLKHGGGSHIWCYKLAKHNKQLHPTAEKRGG